MFENSLIYSFFLGMKKALAKLKNAFDHSYLAVIVTAVSGFFGRVFAVSFIKRLLFDDLRWELAFEKGIFGGINRICVRVFSFSQNTGQAFSDSKILQFFKTLFDNILFLSIQIYGIFFIELGGLLFIVNMIKPLEGLLLYFCYGLLVMGTALLFINRSLSELVNGSWLLKTAVGFFQNGKPKLVERRICLKESIRPLLLLIIFAFILAICAAVLTPSVFLIAFAGIVGGVLVLWKTEIGIYALAFLIPLMPTKIILGLCVVMSLSFIVRVFFTGAAKLRFQMIDFFVLLFAILIIYSIFISYIPVSSAVTASTYILFILIYFIVKNTIKTKEQLFIIISLLAVSALLVSLYGIYQRYTGSYINTEAWLDSDMFETAAARIYSTLDNPNILGEYLLFTIPMAFAMLYYLKNPLYRLFSAGILAASGLCMVLTLSRGAWLGLILAIGIFILLRDRKLIWPALIVLLIVPFMLSDTIIERFTSIGNMSDGSTAYRVNIWMASLNMAKVFWPTGIGLSDNVFIYIYQKFAFNAVHAPHSHNLYLQILIDLGIAGIILFIIVMCCFFKALLRKSSSKDSFISAVSAALCGGMAGYLLQGMTDYVWYSYRIVLYFWLALALSGILMNINLEEKANGQKNISK